MSAPRCCPKCGCNVRNREYVYTCEHKHCGWWIKEEDWPVLKNSLRKGEHGIRVVFKYWWEALYG